MDMPRIAICDLLMCWPPDAGAFVDVVEIATRLSREAEVLLILPRIESFFSFGRTVVDIILERYSRFYLRGAVTNGLPFPVKHVEFSGIGFKPESVAIGYEKVLNHFQPSHTFISNGWHMKANFALALAHRKPILRIYSHEMLCPKADGWFYRKGKVCERNHLGGDFANCLFCATEFYMRCPAVRWVQEWIRSGAYRPSYSSLVKKAFGCASTIVVYNEWTAQRVRPFSNSVKVIPSGVAVERFALCFESANHRSKDRLVVAVPGRVAEPHKGKDFLKQIMRLISIARPEICFHITGTQSGFSGCNVQEVGWLNQSALPQFYQHADLALIPSLWPEPQGIVALEAMATGLPLIVTSVGGLQDLVVHEECGIVVNPGDVRAACDAIIRLADSIKLRQEMGAKARERAQRYSWDNIFETHYRPLFLRTL
jgi:glycosyltransferase involved in cell wall biosynthesis